MTAAPTCFTEGLAPINAVRVTLDDEDRIYAYGNLLNATATIENAGPDSTFLYAPAGFDLAAIRAGRMEDPLIYGSDIIIVDGDETAELDPHIRDPQQCVVAGHSLSSLPRVVLRVLALRHAPTSPLGLSRSRTRSAKPAQT